MTYTPAEVPRLEDIRELGIDVVPNDDGNIDDSYTITLEANDGDVLTCSWDTTTNTSFAKWERDGRSRITMTRELLERVTVNSEHGTTEVTYWSKAEDFSSKFRITVGDAIEIEDVLLES